jgi:hypothetical protein
MHACSHQESCRGGPLPCTLVATRKQRGPGDQRHARHGGPKKKWVRRGATEKKSNSRQGGRTLDIQIKSLTLYQLS